MRGNGLNRRQVIAAIGASLSAPMLFRGQARAQAARNPLPPLAVLDGRMEGGVRAFDLSVGDGLTPFLPGLQTRTIGVNQSYLGPVLRMRKGERVRVNVANGIDEPMTMHWHGMHLPAIMDGGPHQSFGPGQTWSPEWQVLQEAGTFWYHGHQMHKTAEHVWAGMAGIIHVEDEGPSLPRSHGEDDFTLVLQDRWFDAQGQMPYTPNMHHLMAGYSGDRAVVNGVLDPIMTVPRGPVRLRLLNASNGSFYDLALTDGRAFTVIASDGGLLPAPVTVEALRMGPAERFEVIVDFSDGAPVALWGTAFSSEGNSWRMEFVEFTPEGPQRDALALPARLADHAPANPTASVTRRDFALEMQRGMGGIGGGMGMGGMGMSFTINGRLMDMDRIDFTVPAGSVETWVFRNLAPMWHTMHVHDTQFRVLTRNGQPPGPLEAGLKDTVIVGPNETVEVQCRFADFTDAVHPYMFHCHILEHEDQGMMGQFTVV